MRCCVDIVKFFLFIFNFLCFLGFCALFGGSIYVLLNGEDTFIGRNIEPSLDKADPENATYFLFLLIGIVVTAFLALFTCLGCCGAATKSGCMLGSFIVILFVLFGGSAGAIIFLHTQFGWKAVEAVLVQELHRNLPSYSADSLLTRWFWDWVQPTFQCCGVEVYSDWKGVAGLTSGWSVPKSCCLEGEEECMYEPSSETVYSDGCAQNILLPTQILFYGIPSIMFISLVFAFTVSASVSSAERRRKAAVRQDPRAEEQYSVGAEEEFSPHQASYSQGYGTSGGPSAPLYPTDNLPYNPGYGGMGDTVSPYYGGSLASYPTGTVPPPHSHVPLLHQAPPSYNEVVSRRK